MPNEESKNIRNIFIAVMLTGLFIFLIGVTLSVKFLVLDRHGKESTYAIITNITRNSTSVRYHIIKHIQFIHHHIIKVKKLKFITVNHIQETHILLPLDT